MAEAVIIDRVEDDDYQGKSFKKVTDKTGKTFNVKYGREGALKAKWPLLVPGTAIEIEWGDYNGKPFVKDFKVVAGAQEIAELQPALEATTESAPPPKTVSEDIKDNMKWKSDVIEINMWWCQLGNRIGDGSLEKDYPTKAVKIKHEYYKKMSEVIEVSFK